MDSKLKNTYGTQRPFKVPEGYFEQFHNQLMANLPETKPAPAEGKVTLMARIRPLLYMAAMFVGMVFMVQALMYVQESRLKTADSLTAFEELYTPEADDFMASSLYSEYALYAYLTMDDFE